jgi:hypothetical protein
MQEYRKVILTNTNRSFIMSVFKISILVAAFLSFALSVGLWFSGMPEAKDSGLFVGLWVPSILSLGNLFSYKGD